MKKRVLLAIHSSTYFNELLRVAEALKKTDSYEPVLFFPHYYAQLRRDVDQSLKAGVVCIGSGGQLLSRTSRVVATELLPEGKKKQRIKKILGALHVLKLINWVLSLRDLNNRSVDNVLVELWYLRRRIRFVRKVIARYAINLVVLGGDLVHYDTACCIRAAHQKRIAAVIVPCTMSDELEMAESYAPMKKYQMLRWQNRFFGRFFPQWVFVHKGAPLLRLPAERALAMELLHLAPPHPWINLSGHADAIAAESEAMIAYYQRCGIPEGQIVLTGMIADDHLADTLQHAAQRRHQLCLREGLPPDKPLIVCAFPPDQFGMVGGRPECDFQSYQELVGFWMRTLQSVTEYNVLVNLHPALDIQAFRRWNNGNLRVVADNVIDLIPLCDIFVASISTVIRWAIACSKPVINYDVYRLRYRDYSNVPGVITIEERGEFVATLGKLARDSAYAAAVRDMQTREAPRWGRLDGKATARLLALMDHYVKKQQA